MIPIPDSSHEFCITDDASDLDLSSLLKESSSLVFSLCSNEIRCHERIRKTYSAGDSLSLARKHGSFHCSGISRSHSTSSLKKLIFRDHIWIYRRYHIVEALEDATVAEDNLKAKESSMDDEIRLVHLLISCAEAAAYRDKSHRSYG